MTTNTDPRVPAALRPTAPPIEPEPENRVDPLRYCIFTTVALLAWVAGPLVVMVFAALGLLAYGQAFRRGLRRSRCLLRSVYLVGAYLAAALVVGVVGVVGMMR